MKKSQPEPPIESPIPFHTGSNGEVPPRPRTARDRVAEEMFRRLVEDKARRLGLSRREFVSSTMGTATALFVINQVYGCSSDSQFDPEVDAGFEVDGGMTEDAGACQALRSDDFVFDVQTHHVNPEGAWREAPNNFESSLRTFPQQSCGATDFVDCFDANHFIRELFVNSETAVAALSQVPAVPGSNPLETEEAAVTRELINRLADSERLLIHGIVVPDRGEEQLDGMQRLKEELQVAAWKVYTQFGEWRLDDPAIGIPFLERARDLDVKIVCAHKGLSFFGLPEVTTPGDIGVVAGMFPDIDFLVYHSGYELGNEEGPYDPRSVRGIDTLVSAVLQNDVGKDGNIYAELGSTWRFLMTSPNQAAHALGKLLLHLGEDRILWGTDSIWYGSPQDQIDAFRAFQIPESMQEEFGYPALTPDTKRKILGLNGAEVYGVDVEATRCAISHDDVARAKLTIAEDPSLRPPSHRRVGPQNRREFLRYLRLHQRHAG